MENQFTTERVALVLLLVSLLTACTTDPTVEALPVAQLRPAQLAVTQAGYGPTARYVYCEAGSCPAPTPKTLVASAAAVPAKSFEPRAISDTVHVSFAFNSPRISETDQKMLTRAASMYPRGDIEIIARSDFIGPPPAQMKVVRARANAMRSIVAKQTQDARITERREVAGPTRVAEAEQEQQRKGTVRFTHPIDVQLKGTPK